MIEGTSGIGKTTLAWQLCHKWANEKLNSLKKYDLVILVRLRKRRARSASNLIDLLPQYAGVKMKDVETSIIQEEKGVLLVCDGFDELPHGQLGRKFYAKIFSGKRLPEATVIVTTHPLASNDFKEICQQKLDRELEIVGFTDHGIKEFSSSVFCGDELTRFSAYINSRYSLYSMMRLPLCAVIVAQIYQTNIKRSDHLFPRTMSELFYSFTQAMILRHLKSTKKVSSKFRMPHLKNLSKHEQFLKIAERAYKGICDNKSVFKELGEDFDDLGLMKKVDRTKYFDTPVAQITYIFFHDALKEYMAAIHIANKLSGQLGSLELQLEQKDMILRFLAGMCNENHEYYSHDLRQWFVKFIGQIWKSRAHALQFVHCVNECPSIMPDLKVEYSEENAFIIVLPEVHIDWYAMGYCIRHIDGRWGLRTTSLVQGNIDLLEKGLKSPPLTDKVQGRLQYLHICKPDVPISAITTSLGEFCQLKCLELLYVSVDENDEKVIKQMIMTGAKGGLKSLTYRTINECTNTSSFIPMLLDDSSLEELLVRTGSKVSMDTELLPRTNTHLKKLTISCELVQPLAALLPNTSLTHLVVDTLVYDSDLPILKSLVTSHSKLQVLELGRIASTPEPTYTLLTSASRNLRELVEVSISNSQLKLKLHQDDYKYLPENCKNSTVCSR